MITITETANKFVTISGTDAAEFEAFRSRYASRSVRQSALSCSARPNKAELGRMIEAAELTRTRTVAATPVAAPAGQASWARREVHAVASIVQPKREIDGFRFTGFGREFIWNSDRNGCDRPDLDGLRVRYAYYA